MRSKTRNWKERIMALALALTLVLSGALPQGTAAKAAGTVNVTFRVTDGTNALAGASVTVDSKTETTGSNGECTITGLTEGESYSYTVAKSYYQTGSGSFEAGTDPVSVALSKEVTSITLNPTAVEITVGGSQSVTATTAPVAGKTCTWQSGNTSIATVSGGVITGAAAGETTITASYGDVQATVQVKVKKIATSLSLTAEVEPAGGVDAQSVTCSVTGAPSGASLKYYAGSELFYEGTDISAVYNNTDDNLIGDMTFRVVYDGDAGHESAEATAEVNGMRRNQKIVFSEGTEKGKAKVVTLDSADDEAEFELPYDAEKSVIKGDLSYKTEKWNKEENKYEESDKLTVKTEEGKEKATATATAKESGLYKITATAAETGNYNKGEAEFYVYVQDRIDFSAISDKLTKKEGTGDKIYDGTKNVTLTTVLSKEELEKLNIYTDGFDTSEGLVFEISGEVSGENANAGKYEELTNIKIDAVKLGEKTPSVEVDVEAADTLAAKVTISKREVVIGTEDVNVTNSLEQTTKDLVGEQTGKATDVSTGDNTGFLESEKEELLAGIKVSTQNDFYYEQNNDLASNQHQVIPVIEEYDNYNLTKTDNVEQLGNLKVTNMNVSIEKILEYVTLNADECYQDESKFWVGKGDITAAVTIENDYFDKVYFVSSNAEAKGGDEQCAVNYNESGSRTTYVYLENEGEVCSQLTNLAELTYYVDVDAPVVKFAEGVHSASTKLDDALSIITFGLYKKERLELAATVEDKPAEENSGKKSWAYTVYKLTEKNEAGEYVQPKEADIKKAYEDKTLSFTQIEAEANYNIPIEYEEGHYIVLVYAEDNVGNAAIYTSNGIVMEVQKPTVKITRITDEGGEEAIQNNKPYSDNVNYKVTVNDYTEEQAADLSNVIVSGIKEYTVSVYDKNEKIGEEKKVTVASAESYYTLSALKGLRDETTDTIEKESNNLRIEVTAIDQAGNGEGEIISQSLMIDKTPPEISTSVSSEATVQNEKYYNKDVTETIVYTEKNFDEKGLTFDLSFEGKEYKNQTLEELKAIEITEGKKLISEENISIVDSEAEGTLETYTKERTNTLTIKFTQEGAYTIVPHCVDTAGNTNQEAEEDIRQEFVIDKTAPVIEVSYDLAGIDIATAEKDRVYTQNSVTATVKIKEKNFYLNNTDEPKFADTQMNFEKSFGTNSTGEEIIKSETIKEIANSAGNWSSDTTAENTDTYKNSSFTFGEGSLEEANYTFGFTYTDLAGNESVPYEPRYFTIDWTEPEGTIQFDKEEKYTWSAFVEAITFGIFKKEVYSVEVTGKDVTSGVKSIKYYKTASKKTKDQIDNWQEEYGKEINVSENGEGTYSISPDEQFIIYGRIEDKAGNIHYLSSNGAIADATPPEVTVSIVGGTSRNGIYSSDVKMKVKVEDLTNNNTYSGLEKVWYKIEATGNVSATETKDLLDNSGNRVQGNQTYEGTFSITAKTFNSNHVNVYVYAQDFSGNIYENKVYTGDNALKIDVTAPVVESFQWNTSAASNSKYYNTTRTATIVVRERNFDPNQVRLNITNTDGTMPRITDWTVDRSGTSDNNINTCTVEFAADGDYTMNMSCTDLAGWTSNTVSESEFTIDKTVPTINVSFDNNSASNGRYYNAPRTATITVNEHNFNGSDVQTAIQAALQSQGISAPGVNGWSTSGDSHSATVYFGTDGDYSFTVNYTDLAGNAATAYNVDLFTIDQTKPEIEIFDIEDKSANNGTVAPGVRYSDVNYDVNSVSITYSGPKHSEKAVDGTRTSIANGESIKMADFAHTEATDDVYTMVAKVTDLAGNSDEKEVTFSVNRFGSNFIFSDETEEFLDDYYNNEEETLVVTEINVDTLTHRGIASGHDGDLKNLKEGTDYTVKESGNEVSWKSYEYSINKKNFEKEGLYNITIDSVDRATNEVNNKIKNADIEFVIDKTAPTVVITGVEDDGQYRANKRDMTVSVADNVAMDRVEVYVDDAKKPADSFNSRTIQRQKGELPYTLESSSDWQRVKAVAVDAAGNTTDTSRPEGSDSEEWISVLVTSNIIVQFYRNTPVFIGSLAGLAAIAAFIFFILAKRRKKDEEAQE